MKNPLFLIVINLFLLSNLQADNVIIIPREQQYYYYPPPYYDYTFPYQPDNGPMRGPNSIEGHKSYEERYRRFDH